MLKRYTAYMGIGDYLEMRDYETRKKLQEELLSYFWHLERKIDQAEGTLQQARQTIKEAERMQVEVERMAGTVEKFPLLSDTRNRIMRLKQALAQ